MTDLTKLKELAERATPGRNFDRLPSAGGGLKYTCTGDDDSLVLRVDHKNGEFGFIGPNGEEDEAFFLACTPQEVLELIAEVERLRQFAAEAYQVFGALDAPANVLDNASDAASGVPLRHETLLPFFAEDYEALRKDAERYRWLIASAWYVGPEPKGDTEAVSWHDHNGTMHGVTAAIDAALEGGGR
ncbi:hypothetical protein [Pseudomonas pseudonitroreducens]|uniref:hypothetical protein n=1 Tax=Pseudomonas pseudonitroreducens TaxID=2892326 RepID=UPI001F290870|nr:hypothetical protein [Pseudomonas pseudonitroreducens]